jgi:magnesium-transporting ATPase (P-type)
MEEERIKTMNNIFKAILVFVVYTICWIVVKIIGFFEFLKEPAALFAVLSAMVFVLAFGGVVCGVIMESEKLEYLEFTHPQKTVENIKFDKNSKRFPCILICLSSECD